MFDVTHRGQVAVLTMRHGKANVLDSEFCHALCRQFGELAASSRQAVVLTAEGPIFCAGVDLRRLLDGGATYLRQFLPALHQLYEAVFFFPKPVVAAINGHAIAGGCVLACAADQRLMAREDGRIGVTELLVGLPFPPLALEIMRFATHHHSFQEVIFGAATYAPDEAIGRGLIEEIVVDRAALLDRAYAAAEELAAISPPAFALSKMHARQPVRDHLERHGHSFARAAEEIWTAPETAQRVQDYVARTLKRA
jgi:enoyl-CoA hydratase